MTYVVHVGIDPYVEKDNGQMTGTPSDTTSEDSKGEFLDKASLASSQSAHSGSHFIFDLL